MSVQPYQFFKELPPWAKGVVVVGGLAVIYFAGKSIFDRIKKDAESKNSKQVVTDSKKDLQSLLNKGIRLSYPVSTYTALASSLNVAFNGFGTAETQVYAIMGQMKNEADILQLIVSFDLRTIKGGSLFGISQADTYKIDLPGAIHDEMLVEEIQHINQILKNNNVDYQF